MDTGRQLAVPALSTFFIGKPRESCTDLSTAASLHFPSLWEAAGQFLVVFHCVPASVAVFCQSKCCPFVGNSFFFISS